MSTVLVTGGSGFVGSHVILQLLAAGHVVRTTVRSLKREDERPRDVEGAGADPGERPLVLRRRSRARRRLARGGGRMRLRDARGVADTDRGSEVGRRIDRSRARRRAAGAARRTRRKASSAWCSPPRAARSTTATRRRRPPFDETSWTNLDGEMSAYVKSKAIAERAGVGLHGRRGRSPRALRDQSRRHLRARSRAGLLVVDRARQALDERDARMPAALLRRRGRARRRRPARSRDDASRGQGRAIHRGLRRCDVDARHRDGAQGAPRRRREEGADAAATRLARAPRWAGSMRRCGRSSLCSGTFATRPARRRNACSDGSRDPAKTPSSRRQRAWCGSECIG